MKPVRPLLGLLPLVVLSAAFLAGCGGSGGDDDTNAVPVTPVTSATPAIMTGPSDTQIATGGSATFRVVASGNGLTYQWYRSMMGVVAPIEDANAPIYATPGTSAADNGALYYVVVTNAAGKVQSNSAKLTVGTTSAKPIVTSQPRDLALALGSSGTLSVAASDALTYQWYKGATAIANATGTSYTISAATAADAGTYKVVVANAAGAVTSRTTAVTVQ